MVTQASIFLLVDDKLKEFTLSGAVHFQCKTFLDHVTIQQTAVTDNVVLSFFTKHTK